MQNLIMRVIVFCAMASSAMAQGTAPGPTVTYPSVSGTSEPLRNAPPAPAMSAGQKPVEVPIHRLPHRSRPSHPPAPANQDTKGGSDAPN